MTIRELYNEIDGDYDLAIKTLKIDKLIDKHIRKLPSNTIFGELFEAGETMDPVKLFESAHAVKGVCLNLGLPGIASLAGEICEEFRPGRERTMTDGEVTAMINDIKAKFEKASRAITLYDNG